MMYIIFHAHMCYIYSMWINLPPTSGVRWNHWKLCGGSGVLEHADLHTGEISDSQPNDRRTFPELSIWWRCGLRPCKFGSWFSFQFLRANGPQWQFCPPIRIFLVWKGRCGKWDLLWWSRCPAHAQLPTLGASAWSTQRLLASEGASSLCERRGVGHG